MQDDRRDESNRWLDSQYDRAAEERRRQEQRDADYKAIFDRAAEERRRQERK
jgi:hypothetical protein